MDTESEVNQTKGRQFETLLTQTLLAQCVQTQQLRHFGSTQSASRLPLPSAPSYLVKITQPSVTRTGSTATAEDSVDTEFTSVTSPNMACRCPQIQKHICFCVGGEFVLPEILRSCQLFSNWPWSPAISKLILNTYKYIYLFWRHPSQRKAHRYQAWKHFWGMSFSKFQDFATTVC